MPFRPEWRVRLDMKQPDPMALRLIDYIAGEGGALVNASEFANDLIAGSQRDAEGLGAYIAEHNVRACAWKTQAPGYHGETIYGSDRRWVRTNTAVYTDQPSKLTGELHCCHVEFKVNGADAIRALGVRSPSDLADFDHRELWRKKFRFYAIDQSKLGRLAVGSRRRTPWIDSEGRDRDACHGAVILRAAQELRAHSDGEIRPYGAVEGVLRYGDRRGLDVRPALIRLPNDAFLPAPK